MPTYQLDECLNDPDFARRCETNAEQNDIENVVVKRLPRHLIGKDDAQVLSEILCQQVTFLTKDRRIARDHPDSIPSGHSGLIIVANAPGSIKTMTVRGAEKILESFKQKCDFWGKLSFKNSVVEITQNGLDIRHIQDGKLAPGRYVSFQGNWQPEMLAELQENAVRPETD